MSAATGLEIAVPRKHPYREIPKQDLREILEQHRKWVESRGEAGIRADLSRVNLEGADLTQVNLRGAFLHKANLTRADLLLADLRGASLTQAKFHEACLTGAKLQGANLQGAALVGATGLLTGQLAGANLFEATLPDSVSEFDGVKDVRQICRGARRLFVAMLLASVLGWLIIATTTDAELLTDSPVLAIPHLGEAVPMVEFYLIAPVLLLGLYTYFHFYTQRLWEVLADLPAIFPDGRILDKSAPWFAMGLARNYASWLRKERSLLALLETAISLLLAYWVVPITLLLFWARYLIRQDLRGTILHVLLVIAAAGVACFLPCIIRGTLGADPLETRLETRRSKVVSKRLGQYSRSTITAGVGLILVLLSLGTHQYAPHNSGRAPEVTGARTWAADLLWLVGYNPYAELTEAALSIKPANWSGRDEDLAQVKGPRLNKLRLRYAEGYRSFLVNAHFWEADLQHAYLSEADLRGANLRHAKLGAAVLDRARMNRANLEQVDLEKANLARADLREANLSFASVADAILADARLDGANLYSANLRTALLLRASLQRADLREAHLEDADLRSANLDDAYLSDAKLQGARLQQAQLQRAMLNDADLRRADFHGANLEGSLLRGADLREAKLDGANLRGARGLSTSQICSAASKRGILLDEDLKHEVESWCGASL